VAEPIRVLHFLDDAQPGGGMTHLLQLARWFDPARVRVAFAVPPDGPLLPALHREHVPVHPIPFRSRLDPLAILRLARLCRGRFELLHSHNARANVHARFAARLAAVPVTVSTVHNSVFKYDVSVARQRLYAAAERRTVRWANRIVAVSSGIAEDLVLRYGIPSAKIVVIPNGIDPECLRPSRPATAIRAEFGVAPSSALIVQVGRLTPQKGFDTLLLALVRIRAAFPSVRTLLVGDGPDRPALESLASRLGIDDCVQFLGYRTDVIDILTAAELVTVPSRSEGMPYTLLEAMGLGRPVVASRIPGIIEVVQDGHTGILIPPNDPAALASAALRVLRNPQSAATFGAHAKTHTLTYFTAERMARSLTDLYTVLLSEAIKHETDSTSF
jgi:glycosyltransferase involved in cell wall biosynthesis